MIAAAVNKEFGVLATNSTNYDTALGEITFQTIKLFYTNKFLLAYMGSSLYFTDINREKLGMDFLALILYLENYLKGMRMRVNKMLKNQNISDTHFCLFLMGIHKKLPTAVQFNSVLDFKPKYLYSEHQLEFSTVTLDGGKNTLDMTTYMQERLRKNTKKLSVGVAADILARGIHKTGTGGIINAAGLLSSGQLIPLSGSLAA